MKRNDDRCRRVPLAGEKKKPPFLMVPERRLCRYGFPPACRRSSGLHAVAADHFSSSGNAASGSASSAASAASQSAVPGLSSDQVAPVEGAHVEAARRLSGAVAQPTSAQRQSFLAAGVLAVVIAASVEPWIKPPVTIWRSLQKPCAQPIGQSGPQTPPVFFFCRSRSSGAALSYHCFQTAKCAALAALQS